MHRYLRSGSPLELGRKLVDELKDTCERGELVTSALQSVQDQVLLKLRTYWVPRYLRRPSKATTPRAALR